MVKIHSPLNSQKARGAIGGLIFSESNQINYVRKNTVKPYVQTAKRKAVAAQLKGAAEIWRALDADEREKWRDFAESHDGEDAFGQKFKKPAFAWYVSCRQNLASIHQAHQPGLSNQEIPRTPISLTTTKTGTTRVQFRVVENPTNTDSTLRLRIYKSKQSSESRIFNFSECEFWNPNTLASLGNVYSYTAEDFESAKGVYTVYAQWINRFSGIAGGLLMTQIAIE